LVRLIQQHRDGFPAIRLYASPGHSPEDTQMQVRFVPWVVLAAVAALASPACGYPLPQLPQLSSADSTAIFEAAVQRIQRDHKGTVRFDSRVMDSIPLQWDYERDTLIAPTPTLLPAAARVQREREAVLARLGMQRERIDDYTACTPYIGELGARPVRQPEATPEAMPAWQAVADSARSACGERETYSAAILGLPRPVEDGSPYGRAWRIRVYQVAAVERYVYDLVLKKEGGEWTVVDQELRLSYGLRLTDP
jgi:hypothetical protein